MKHPHQLNNAYNAISVFKNETVNIQETPTFKMTLWSACSSNRLSVGKASICCLIDWAMAGTKDNGGKSKSSQRASANCSGVIRDSEIIPKFKLY